MPKNKVAAGMTRLEISIQECIVSAARAKAGQRNLSSLIGRLLAEYAGQPYTPPRYGRRPDPAKSTEVGKK